MTAPTTLDVGMRLIRLRGTPCSEPGFIVAYLVCEVARERAARARRCAANVERLIAAFEGLRDAFVDVRAAFAGVTPPRQGDFVLAGPGERA